MNPASHRKYTEANEKAWDEVTPIHQSYRSGEADYFRKGGCTLDSFEIENLPELHGKKVAHLCCNCGQDTLSLVNLGASCTGFDQSGKAIEEGKKLSSESGVEAEFVKSNVLGIPDEYNGLYDLVYISIGVLVWIPDIPGLIAKASRLLKTGGELFIYDQHPVVHLFDPDSDSPMEVRFSYFDPEPTENRGLDYIGGKKYDAKPNFQFMVRLSDILNGMSESGLRLTRFLEYSHSIEDSRPSKELGESSGDRKYPGTHSPKIPNTMLIRAVKEER